MKPLPLWFKLLNLPAVGVVMYSAWPGTHPAPMTIVVVCFLVIGADMVVDIACSFKRREKPNTHTS